jgi:hypothetical protein
LWNYQKPHKGNNKVLNRKLSFEIFGQYSI